MALRLWAEQIGYQLGNWGLLSLALAALAGLAVVISHVARRRGPSTRLHLRQTVAVGAAAAMGLALYVAMYAKLNSIAWPESSRVYYWIPGAVVISIGFAWLVGKLLEIWPGVRFLITGVLLVMLASNVVSLPAHAAVVAAGDQAPQIAEAPRVRDCIRDRRTALDAFDLTPGGALACYSVRRAAFGSAAITGLRPAATPNPLLFCRKPRAAQPALRSLGP
jgi:hypothetical protein